jgi:CRISPR/Cas system-associated exonuclease Cas4 (RecB family)
MKLAHSYSSIKTFENCPLKYYRIRVAKDVKDEGGEASLYGDRIHKFLEERLKGAKLPREAQDYEPLCQAVEGMGGVLEIEKELVLTENLKPTGWWDSDAWLRSKLDILVLRGASAVVMDWKTGKRRPDFLQMQMFALQVFEHYPEVQQVRTSFVWLRDMAMDHKTYSREERSDMWLALHNRIDRIKDAYFTEVWPPRPSGLCKFCPAKPTCNFAY